MKKFLFSALAVLVSSFSYSQQSITLEEIWSGAFSTEGIANLRSLNSGDAYTVLEYNDGKSQIVKYRYNDMQSVGVLLSSGETIPRFSGYTFSDDESRVLLELSENRFSDGHQRLFTMFMTSRPKNLPR